MFRYLYFESSWNFFGELYRSVSGKTAYEEVVTDL